MHFKLDILQKIKVFVTLVHNQFYATIKAIRTDNATYFFKRECADYFSSLRIIHQSSCAYTPQQNGLVERKHRHILNVARSFMFQASLPQKYWGDLCSYSNLSH